MTRASSKRHFPTRLVAFGALAAAGVLLLPSGCTSLSLLPENTCGNLVLEPDNNEACDGEAGCGAAGTEHACQYLCAPLGESKCPEELGYRCGMDGVCRRPSGTFQSIYTDTTNTALDFMVGDVNADGCSEIVHTTLHGSTLTAFPSDVSESCVGLSQSLPVRRPEPGQAAYPAPLFTDLTSNGHLEMLVTTRGLLGDGLFVYFADAAPSLSSLLYPSTSRSAADVRQVTAKVYGRDALFLFLDTGGTQTGVAAVLDPHKELVDFAASLPFAFAKFQAAQAADLDGGPCDELVVAEGGATALRLYSLCDPNASMDSPPVFAPLSSPTVQLDAGAKLRDRNAAITLIDFDGDQNLDLITNADDDKLHIAYGLGDGHFHSSPPPFPAVPDQTTSELPIADAMLKAGVTDPNSLFVAARFDPSQPGVELVAISCPPADSFQSPVCSRVAGGCEVRVEDIDADGYLDILSIEEEQPGIVLRRRLHGGGFHVSSLETQCPPHFLASGDFDSDGVNDLAFFDQVAPAPNDAKTTLSVAYGNAFDVPDPPRALGRFEVARALSAGHFVQDELGAQLIATRSVGDQKSALALIEGQSERLLLAPFYLAESKDKIGKVTPLAVTAGQFALGMDGKARPAIITSARGPMAEVEELWLLDLDENTKLLHTAYHKAPEGQTCGLCILSPVDTDGDGHDELLFFGDHKVFVYDVGVSDFTKKSELDSNYGFVSNNKNANPPNYTPRPLVVDLDGDGALDVIVREANGALVAFFGDKKGSFVEKELVPAPSCGMGKSCGGQSIALFNVDQDPEKEAIVIGPGSLEIYDIDQKARKLVSKGLTSSLPVPSVDTDFTAVGAGDFDGDGVDDLAIMSGSSFINVFRGVPGI